jgi:phage terminase small subunit
MTALKNPKHEAVLKHHIAQKDRVGWRSYKHAYPKSSKKASEVGWSRLLKNAKFAARLKELQAKIVERVVTKTAITKEMVVAELAKIGFSNMGDYVTIGQDGLPFVDMTKVNRDQMAAVQEVHVETITSSEINEDGEREAVPVRKVRFKLGDKRASLVDIGKHLGMFATDPLNGMEGGPTLAELIGMSYEAGKQKAMKQKTK